jgi:GAF domain-containing protein
MTSFNLNSTKKQEKLIYKRGSWLENTKVSWKLTLIITALILGTFGVFYSAFVGFQGLNHQISNMYDLTLLPVASLDRADIALGNIEVQLETLQNKTLTRSEIVDILNTIETTESTFNETLQRYKPTSLNADFTKTLAGQDRLDLQKEEASTLSNIKLYYESYSTQRNKLITSFEEGNLDSHFLETTKAAIGATRNYLRHLTDINRSFADVSNKAANTAYQQALLIMRTTLMVSAVISLILAFVVARSITKRLGLVTLAAQSIQHGQFEHNAIINVGGKDEIGQLAVAFDSMALQLTQTLTGLEQRVQERTSELIEKNMEIVQTSNQLEKQALQQRAVSEVARNISSIRNIDDLLPEIAKVISEQFGFYHIGIFLNDQNNEFSVLRGSNSDGGKRMLERGHRLNIGQVGIVGYVAGTGQPRIALDTGTDAVFFNNPDLPDTRSEMALPLNKGETVLGVLDVQSTEPAAFDKQDIEILGTLADLVNIAIQNANLFASSQKASSEAQTLLKQYTRTNWDRVARLRATTGYKYSITGSQFIENPLLLNASRITASETHAPSSLAIPILVHDEVIGVLGVKIPDDRTLNQDEIEITQAIAERVALAIENARLLEETSTRAERERMVADISNKIRSTNDPEMMVRTAMEELKHALGATSVQITPYKPSEPKPAIPIEVIEPNNEHNNGSK